MLKVLKPLTLKHLNLAVVVFAAMLVVLMMTVMYYSAEKNITYLAQRYFERETKVGSLRMSYHMVRIEIAVRNMAWVVQRNLGNPEAMFQLVRSLMENNPEIAGSSISFIADYYPEKGRWYEPYAVRLPNGDVETKQLGISSHDYFTQGSFVTAVSSDSVHWSEPYLDQDAVNVEVTTYSVPVHDHTGKVVAVVDADLAISFLDSIMATKMVYPSTRSFLFSKVGNVLVGRNDRFAKKVFHKAIHEEEGDNRTFILDDDGTKEYIFCQNVGGPAKWTLVNVCHEDDILDGLRTVRLFLLLMLVAATALIWFIVMRTMRHLERLHEANKEKDRIATELHVASEIQQSMLPRHKQVSGIDICGSLVPAREVGGDLFDYYERDGKLFFCIGDVTGKGAPSAMLMAVTHSLFRAFSAYENNPARIMQYINVISCKDNDSNMFATLFIGVLDLPTGHLYFCNAGHDKPFILSKEGNGPVQLDCLPHLPIGVFDDVTFEYQETCLKPDSTIFLYTDGLTEAKSRDKKMFGLDRVKKALAECAARGHSPEDLLAGVTETLRRFVGTSERSDDLTMLAIRYVPERFDSLHTATLTLRNNVGEVTKLSSFMKSEAEKMEISPTLARKLRLAVEEAVVNVIQYAYPKDTEGSVDVALTSDGKRLMVKIEDSGVPFDPTKREAPDLSVPAEARQIGGLGILLVRELMDEINYERKEGRNVLTMWKKI